MYYTIHIDCINKILSFDVVVRSQSQVINL